MDKELEKDGQKPEGSPENQSKEEWDKAKQEADQLKANLKKKQAELDYALSRVADNEQKLQQTMAELDKVRKAQAAPEKASSKLTEEDYGKPLLQVIESLEQRVDTLQKANEELTSKAKEFETEQTLTKQQQIQRERENKILDRMDKEFGAKFRNDARKLAMDRYNELSATEKKSWTELDAVVLVRDCYKELADADKKKTKVPVQDDGEGGAAPMFDDILPQQGKPKDLVAAVLKDGVLEKMLERGKKK